MWLFDAVNRLRESRRRDVACHWHATSHCVGLKQRVQNARQSSTTIICSTQNSRGLKKETWHATSLRWFFSHLLRGRFCLVAARLRYAMRRLCLLLSGLLLTCRLLTCNPGPAIAEAASMVAQASSRKFPATAWRRIHPRDASTSSSLASLTRPRSALVR